MAPKAVSKETKERLKPASSRGQAGGSIAGVITDAQQQVEGLASLVEGVNRMAQEPLLTLAVKDLDKANQLLKDARALAAAAIRHVNDVINM